MSNLDYNYQTVTVPTSTNNIGMLSITNSLSNQSLFTITSNGNLGIGTITSNNSIFTTHSADVLKDFENKFPNWNDFESMCKEYPSLEKSFSNMKQIYDLCKDDWASKKKGNL